MDEIKEINEEIRSKWIENKRKNKKTWFEKNPVIRESE